MLTELEVEQIEAEYPKYEQRRAVSVEALKIVQRHRGWVSDEALTDLAGLLEMSVAELDAVATFYNLIYRKPVGRHVILVCNSVSCWIMGSDNLLVHLSERLGVGLGETTADNRFTLLPVVCLGACDRAPAVMIDDDLHCRLDPDSLDELFHRYR